jgi:hypothetical protein
MIARILWIVSGAGVVSFQKPAGARPVTKRRLQLALMIH